MQKGCFFVRTADIIKKKRDGGILSREEIRFFICGIVSGEIPDYQASALLMAIYFKGMNEEETVNLTLEMAQSGDMVDLSEVNGITCDKHSTGGVGDKTTLIVAPIVASSGGKIAKMSGRGLGHTGGTIDKLESIPGFRTTLTSKEFIECVNTTGLCIIGQSGNLAPADKILYALRDVTATVESTALIASSIMSKKLAAGSSGIVLDVKYGSGSFMKTKAESKILAREMVNIGNSAGRHTSALITNMDIPLGNAIGNSLEVIEAVSILQGRGPADLWEVCREIAASMLMYVTGKTREDCLAMADRARRDGTALNKLREMVAFQGGNTEVIDDTSLLPKAKYSFDVLSEATGHIEKMDTEKIGHAAVCLGAGREKKGDSIDMGAGIILHRKTGSSVVLGEKIATLYSDREDSFVSASVEFTNAITIGNKPEIENTIYKIIR